MQGRIKDFFSGDRKTLYMILSIVLISIFSLTIVYAALSVTLNIQGSAQVSSANWDIHLDNVKVTSGSVGGTTPSITSPTTTTFSTTLNMPGDFYEFTIDVVNNGTIDAMIDGVTKTPTLTTEQAKYLNYIIEYQNGESINTKQLVAKNSFVRLKVRVEFRKDVIASDLPTALETLNLAFTVNYIQSDGSIDNVLIENNGKAIKVVSGTGTNTSDEVCIGEECFYVMYSDEETVTMLAKYNLHVGNVVTSITFDEYYNDISEYRTLDKPTGIQDSAALGSLWSDEETATGLPWIGTISFSNTRYWGSYADKIYNQNSNLYKYVENYKSYLELLNVNVEEARIIFVEELYELGCDEENWNCDDATPNWIFTTSYWIDAGGGSDSIIGCVYNEGFKRIGNRPFNSEIMLGIRPVVTISKSLL